MQDEMIPHVIMSSAIQRRAPIRCRAMLLGSWNSTYPAKNTPAANP